MNNFKTGKNLFGISQYGSSGLYVDLLTDQSISGIKRFLSNLITNSNVNFNTTGNIGRIVFRPNEASGFGGNLVAIYTTDENDGQGWIFDSSGFLYYIGTGFISQKIIFDPTGQINAVGAITGSSLSAGTGTISTTGNISGGSLFCGSGAITGGALSATTGNFSSNVNITGATNGLIISGGFSGLFCNKIESQSGGAIVSSAVFNLRSALAVTNITLDPLNTIRLKINGITGTNSYLFFNNSNTLGFFNTSTGTNTYTITDLGVATFTSLLTNSIAPSSGTAISVGITSNFNFLKSAGVNRILMFPSSTSGDILQICRVGDTSYTSGYWYHNNTGNFGYNTSGATVWELLNTGGLNLTNDLGILNNARIFCNKIFSNNYSTYQNSINFHQLCQNVSISSIELSSQYVCLAHPSSVTTTASKYLYISPAANNDTGNFYIGINNLTQAVIATDIPNLRLVTDFIWEYRKPSFVSGAQYIRFINGSTVIGSVSMLTSSTVNYNISSDYRLKQDIKPLTDSLDRLMLLRPKSYRFIHDVESGQDFTFDGFIAHEVENIIPMAVTGVKDDPNMMQQMDYSKLTPLLTGGIQELNKKVDKQQKLIEEMTKRLNKQEEMIQNLIMLINNK